MAVVAHTTVSAAEILPDDAHNTRLLAQAHPRDWRNPVPRNPYNLVVIGAGPAGLIAAAGAAGLGAHVALVEQHLMGGDCLNYGCVPSKALLRCATAWADVRDASRYGVHYHGDLQVDFGVIMERLRRLRADLSANDAVQRFTALGVDVFLGHGGFTGPCALNVEGETLTFARAVIATGCHAGAPPIPGLADSGYLTNESIFALTERPQRLGVIGGGPIGCELAQAFQRLGSQVTLLEADTHLLPREDAEAAAIVHQALCRDGVQVTVGAKIAEVATRGALKIVRHTILMTHKLGLGALTRIIQPYPTQAEAVRKTGDAYQRTRLTPFVKKLMARWFAWQRGR